MTEPRAQLRVAHISDCYLPRTGGIETQVAALVHQQVHDGLMVSVITATRDAAEEQVSTSTNPIVHRVVARMPWNLPIHPRTRHHVQRLLQQCPVDVVHVHLGAVSPFAWGGIRAAHRLNLPILVTVHSMWGPLARIGYRLSNALVHWTRWRLRIAAVSPVAAEAIAHALPQSTPILILPNGIDPTLWAGAAHGVRQIGHLQMDHVETDVTADAELRLVSVLRLAPRKRVLPLLQIADRAGERSGRRVNLTVIGDGPERSRAEHRARQLRHCRVQFTGRLDRVGIQQQFADADLFVQPSVRESFGLAALEARTWGLPVIARSQSGSGAFITDGITGRLVDSDEAMAAVLADLAINGQALGSLQVSTRLAPLEQTWPVILQSTLQAYRELG